MTIEIIRPADRGAWLAARNFDVTASVAASLLGAHPYTTPYQLWAEKTGRLSPDDEETEAMERGNLLEPVAVAMVRKRHPEWTVTYENDRAYYRDGVLRIGATPDAFMERPDRFGTGNMQIKSASEDAFNQYWLDADTGEVIPPTWIAVQSITEAKLTGCDWACVAVVVVTWRGNLRLHVIDIPMHDRLWMRLVGRVAEFWAMVQSGEEPEPDWLRDGPTVLDVYRDTMPERRDLTGDAVLDEEVSRFMRAKQAEREASAIADAIRPRLIHALGNAEAGETANWQFSARAQHRDSYVVKPSSMRVLRVKPRENLSGSF